MIPDCELVREIAAGSRAALAVLVDRHYQTVFAYIYRQTGDYHLSCDLTQEAFIKMIKGVVSYRERGKFLHWLLKIAVNCCRDYYRSTGNRAGREVMLSADLPDDKGNVHDIFSRKADRERVKAALASLPPLQREVIILKFYHDLKTKEIAALTQAFEPTVKSRLREGLKKLKKMLLEDGGESGVFREEKH
jgi:RNA polymerase sigma-70 factor (ECF subfamily)